jgi:hypothetical protein
MDGRFWGTRATDRAKWAYVVRKTKIKKDKAGPKISTRLRLPVVKKIGT